MTDRKQLELAIAAQERLRGVVGDEVVDMTIAALRRELDAAEPEPQRRRQVTVLFADVTGFTAMTARLDPEAVANLMNELWARLDTIVADHGGRVDKHIGDAVMAVWGGDTTREDDPERAVRAGLAMQYELASRAEGDGVTMRVGINTGPVYLGGVGAGSEVTAMGDAVNIASRMQSAAPVGGVLVSHDTYRHIRGLFDVEPLGPKSVKGRDEPVAVYLVRRAKERAFRMHTRGVEGVETQMIGRATDLDALRAEFEHVVATPAVRRVTVIGEAGIGKSRLLYEFENWIDLHPAHAYFFKGRALASRTSDTFGLVRDMLGDRFGVLDSDTPAAVAAKLHIGFGSTLTASEADLVGHWLGFDFGASPAVQGLLGSGQLAATARAHLVGYFTALGVHEPVVMFLEDLHWADDDSLGLFDQLVAQLADTRVLVVGVARPALLERDAADGLLERSSVVLRLEPLGATETRALVDEVLQRAERVPDNVAGLIAGRAEGNAFFVEELVKMLIDDGVIEPGELGDPWRIHADRLDPERVPASLTGVLQARLDGLGGAERGTLQRASVVGRVFWDAAVATLGPEDLDAAARSLDDARRRELVFRRDRSSFDDCVEYAFKHALLREVTYETVLLRDRQRLHGLVAEWLTDNAGERLIEHAGLIAGHHRLAGDFAAAADLLSRAGVAALDSGNSAGARRSLDDALSLWQVARELPPARALIALAEVCIRLGDLANARRYSDEALHSAAAPEERGDACYIASWVASEVGDRDREQALLEEALPFAEQFGGSLLSKVLSGLGWAAVARGDGPTATTLAARLEEVSRQLTDPAATRRLLGTLGLIASTQGDNRGALRHSQAALTASIESGDLEGQALAHGHLGVSHHLLGDEEGSVEHYRRALEHYEQANALDRQLGQRVKQGLGLANIGQVHVRLGDDASARRLILEALTLLREAGATSTLMFAVMAEADRRLSSGDTSRALELFGIVHGHPALSAYDASEIERIIARSGLPTDVIEQGLAAGAGQDFDAAVDRVMHELATRRQWS